MPKMSVSWKAPLPIMACGTWPVMATSGHGIHVGVGDAGDQVGGARAAGGHADAGPAGGAGVAAGGERAALLVARQDRADLLRAGQRLVDFHARARRGRRKWCPPLRVRGRRRGFRCRTSWGRVPRVCRPVLSWFGFSCFAHVVVAVVAGGRGCIKKPTTVCQPWVLVETQVHARQAPTASPTTTTTSTSTTCRMFTNIGSNVVNRPAPSSPCFGAIIQGFLMSARTPSVAHNWGRSHTLSTFR